MRNLLMRLGSLKQSRLLIALLFLVIITGCGSASATQGLSDADSVGGAKQALTEDTIKGGNTGLDNVTENLSIPTQGLHNTTINWSSSNPDVLQSNGIAVRPAESTGDIVVTLRAQISKNAAVDTKEFTVKVKASGTRTDKLDNYFSVQTKNSGFSGAVLVAENGQIVLQKGYGFADASKSKPNIATTIFRIGSVTKQFVAMGIMMLQEKGLLSVQDKLSKYIPDYLEGNKITIHHLLTHTSGIPDYTRGSAWGYTNCTPESLISTFKNRSLQFEPGTQFSYSNSNYVVLGYIIEKVSGRKFDEFLKQNIFLPLGMNDTGYMANQEALGRLAVGYWSAYSPSFKYDNTVTSSAGGIYSTVGDMYKWDQALYTEKLVSKETLEKIFTPYSAGVYGYGWEIYTIPRNGTLYKQIVHTGEVPGYQAINSRYDSPNIKRTVIVLCNVQRISVWDIDGKVNDLLDAN